MTTAELIDIIVAFCKEAFDIHFHTGGDNKIYFVSKDLGEVWRFTPEELKAVLRKAVNEGRNGHRVELPKA